MSGCGVAYPDLLSHIWIWDPSPDLTSQIHIQGCSCGERVGLWVGRVAIPSQAGGPRRWVGGARPWAGIPFLLVPLADSVLPRDPLEFSFLRPHDEIATGLSPPTTAGGSLPSGRVCCNRGRQVMPRWVDGPRPCGGIPPPSPRAPYLCRNNLARRGLRSDQEDCGSLHIGWSPRREEAEEGCGGEAGGGGEAASGCRRRYRG